MATQAELEAQSTELQQEASAIETENARLAALKESIDAQNQLIATRKAEEEQAKFQLGVARKTQSDTTRYELLLKQRQTELASEVERAPPLIEGYNKAGQELNLRSEVLKSKAEEFNAGVEVYNKEQAVFGEYLQSVAEGGNAPDVININPYTYPGSGGDTVFGYSSSQNFRNRYSGGTSYWGEKFGRPWATAEEWAIAGTKSYLGLGAEDVIYYGGKLVQASSFTPEQMTIALSVASGRQAALEKYKQEQALEQDRLKTGMLIGGTATFVQPASYIEAYKAIIGNAPSAAQVNITPYVQSEEQLRAKAIILSSKSAQFSSPDIYASEYAKIKERTAYPIEAIGTKKLEFAPAVEVKDNQIQFYGVEGNPGVQWSKSANEARIAEINKAPAIITPSGQNIVITSPAPEQPEFIWNEKYGLMKRADLVKTAEQKIIEDRDKEAERLGLNTGWEGTKTREASAYLIKKSTEAEEAITEWENELNVYNPLGVPDYGRIFEAEAAKGIVGIGTIIAGLPIITYGAYEKPTLMYQTIKTVAEPAVLTAPRATTEMITVPIKERGYVAGGVAIAGTVTGFYLGGKALGIAGKGIKDTGASIKEGIGNIKVTEPSYSLPGLLVKPKGRAQVLETVTKTVTEKPVETIEITGITSEGKLITRVVKPIVEPKTEVIDLITINKAQAKIEARSMGTTDATKVKPFKSDVQQVKQFPQTKTPTAVSKVHTPGDILGYEPSLIKSTETATQYKSRIAEVKAELNIGSVSGVKPFPIIVAGQKGKAVLKTVAPTISITRTATGLDTKTAQEAKAVTISAAIQKGMTGQRQEAPQITKQKQKEKYVPVLIAKTGLNLKPVQDIGQIMKTPSSTRTKTTEITTPRIKIPRTPEETPPKQPPKKPPPKFKDEGKGKALDLGIKTTEPKIEELKKKGKGNPLYPASFENVNIEEFQLGGKRAKHIRERKVTQELFEEQKKGGRSIPTLRQYKKRKAKG